MYATQSSNRDHDVDVQLSTFQLAAINQAFPGKHSWTSQYTHCSFVHVHGKRYDILTTSKLAKEEDATDELWVGRTSVWAKRLARKDGICSRLCWNARSTDWCCSDFDLRWSCQNSMILCRRPQLARDSLFSYGPRAGTDANEVLVAGR
ncbi:hypothetical protein MRB53_038875 [Persea americana]|nr:hypothetical protein MRB53_038875 [Persea americana]